MSQVRMSVSDWSKFGEHSVCSSTAVNILYCLPTERFCHTTTQPTMTITESSTTFTSNQTTVAVQLSSRSSSGDTSMRSMSIDSDAEVEDEEMDVVSVTSISVVEQISFNDYGWFMATFNMYYL
jgi:hypothetical protein